MEIAAKFLQKKSVTGTITKQSFTKATNNYKEHKYFKQNPRLSKLLQFTVEWFHLEQK